MTAAKRVRLNPEARRAQLIALGVEMLATRTLDELSVEEIAAQAGISRGLLFHYFSSKQEFHIEVARAAADELLSRTAPDMSLSLVDALHGALESFVAYVEENPDGYKSLVRGAAAGDTEMRAIFSETRGTLAHRVIDIVGALGFELTTRAALAVHGWVAYVEECAIQWIDGAQVSREELITMLTKALPSVVLAATDEEVGTLVQLLTSQDSIAGA